MRALDKKLIRDLSTIKGQVLAIALVMACGLAVMTMARGLVVSLESSRDRYYQDYQFADVFVDLKRAPNALRHRLAEIPGVSAVETRVHGLIKLEIPGVLDPVSGEIFSIPEDRQQQLNLLYLRRGRLPNTGSRGEVVVGEAFANAHGFQPGDSIDAVIRGSKQRLEIVGIVLTPEFVYELRPGHAIPDHYHFGVFWMNERHLAVALDQDGSFNQVLVRMAPGEDTMGVMAMLDTILKPYGGLIAYDRDDHASAKQLEDRIHLLRGVALVFPAVFLTIAIFMTSAAMTRLIRLQREQIAQLKALGYRSSTIGMHYMKFALVIVCVGCLIGGMMGLKLGVQETEVYRRFFQFPELAFQPDWSTMLIGACGAVLVCAIGVSSAVWQAVRLPPAEAMRPEPPPVFRRSLLEKLKLHRWCSPSLLMALRNLERKPWQALFTMLGLALATAIPIIPNTVRSGVAYVMDFQWNRVQHHDVTLHMLEPTSFGAWTAIDRLPGVMESEAFRTVPARLVHEHAQRRIPVTGVLPDARLERLMDDSGNEVVLPTEGVLLSAKLAEVLGLKPGDSVRIEVQEGKRPVWETVVVGTIADYAGISAYMNIHSLRRLMQEGEVISGVRLKVDPLYWKEFLHKVKESPQVGALSVTENVRASFKRNTAEMLDTIQVIYLSFAVIVAFGVVYNSARIALSERNRDLATLRVVGFHPREVAAVLIGELAILTLMAIPVGLYLGSELAALIVRSVDTETVRLPLILTYRSYAVAVLVILVSSSLSFALVSKRIHQLDLLGVLNVRD
jgi:putative ABC transport system permease protein